MIRSSSVVRRQLVCLLACVLAPPSAALAQRERYAPLVLQLPTDARSLSMGGAGVAIGGAAAAFRNPSLMGDQSQMSLSLARFSQSARSGAFSSVGKFGRVNLGFGLQYLDYSRALEPYPTPSRALATGGEVPASALAAAIAASITWKGIRWGTAAKYVEDRGALAKDGTLAFDVGAAKDLPFGNLTAGAVIQNVGTSLSLAGTRAQLPGRLSLGVQGGGYNMGAWLEAGVVAQLSLRRDGEVLPAAGGELTFHPLEGVEFAVRAGGRRPELQVERPMTAGVGFSLDRYTLDYAWEQLRTGSGAHRVTVRVR